MRKVFLTLIYFVFTAVVAEAQTYITPVRSDITPPSPQSSSLIEVQAPQPELMTGAANLCIPVYTIAVDNFSCPVTLQYHSNGIKVFDDPAPVGYGWSLQPALRITRTIGRPDEKFRFSGDPNEALEPNAMCYMCSFSPLAPSYTHTQRYDSEHDIINISLPDRTLTRVIDVTPDTIRFISACDSEYKVEADSVMNTIIVTDPSGMRYYFGAEYEGCYDRDDIFMRTAWALYKIVTDNGRIVTFSWSHCKHPVMNRKWIGGHSFMDRWDLYQWGNSGKSQEDFENDNFANGVLTRNSETTDFLRLDSVTFPGGNVTFSYEYAAASGYMLKAVNVCSADETIKSYKLRYADDYCTLLTEIDGGAGNKYTFDYNTRYGTNPHSSWSNWHAQDWWGYYNGKDNASLTPDLKVKTYYSTTNTTGTYKEHLGDADRSVDTTAMQALILTKVTWPTGGTSKFEYEPHRFAPARAESDGEVAPESDPYLSVGGGLRVKTITTSAGTRENDMVVRYEYPLATVRAVPSAATFVEAYDVVFTMPDVPAYTDDPVSRMRLVNISPVSDYMRYDIGVTPLWYDHVSTIWAEGKTESYFQDVLPQSYLKPVVSFGARLPNSMTHVFDGAPVMTKQVIFRTDGNNYTPVETTAFKYETRMGSHVPGNYHIERNVVYIDDMEMNAPDLIDGSKIHGGSKASGAYAVVENGYASRRYVIYPYAKYLIAKSHTVHTETGDVTTTEQYSYKPDTGLLTKVVTDTSEDLTSTVTVDYPDQSRGNVQAAMVAANFVDVPVKENITRGTAVTDITAQYAPTGSGAFRQLRTATSFGATEDSLYSPTCHYDRLGHLTRVIDADSIIVDWTWDNAALYPVLKIQDGIITRFHYKNLVGLSSITQPFGAATTFHYDNLNRLVGSEITGLGKMQSIAYHIAPDANRITTETWLDNNRKLVATDYFDNLGRKIKSENTSAGISSHIKYDAMGRAYATSIPSANEPSEDYDYAIICYEQSPRGVISSSIKNGQAWHENGKKVTVRTFANLSDGNYSAPLYRIGADGNVAHSGNYTAGQLLIEEATDEDGHVTRSYINKNGLTVMTEEGDGFGEMFRTRNIYDDYGRLRFVLTPAFADGNFSATDDSFIKNCHEIRYDKFGRQNYVRLAGATAAKRTAYSRAGRVLAEQTAAMAPNNWTINFYDRKGRLCYTALNGITDTEVEWLTQNFSTAEFDNVAYMDFYAGYKLTPEPRLPVDVPYSAAYFDNYDFLGNVTWLPDSVTLKNRPGLQTGGYDAETGRYALIYDDYGRVIARYEGASAMTYTLDRAGNTLSVTEKTLPGKKGSQTMTTTFTYDNAARIKSWVTTFGDGRASAQYTYDHMGKMKSEKLGNNVERAFEYDCHGWLTNATTSIPTAQMIDHPIVISPKNGVSEQFYNSAMTGGNTTDSIPDSMIAKLKIDYTEKVWYDDSPHPRYNGTPSAHQPTLGGRYDYVFDTHDRLVKADYTPADNSGEDFSTEYTYNSTGAPLTVKRMGISAVLTNTQTNVRHETFNVLDNLTYSWDGMLLTSVTAKKEGSDYYGRPGYPLSHRGGTGQYVWNSAGLLKADSARQIKIIHYTPLSLPKQINFNDGSCLDYKYRADGTLHQLITYSLIPGTRRLKKVSERTYAGNCVYEGDSLLYANFPGGYFDGAGQVHYRHADTWGNIAMVTDRHGEIEQHNGYYPYGEPWREPSGQPNLFAGKERRRDGALNDYDFTARCLNSALCLWSTPDPCTLTYTPLNPYIYCAANPIRYTDPSGKIITENGVPFQYSCGRPVSIPENKLIKSNEKDLEEATYNVCCLFTSAGVPFIALQLTDKKETNELTPSGFDYTSNCHGYTFLNGEYWINSESSVDAVLSEYLPISNPDLIEAGDVVVYKTENTDDNPAEFGSGDLIYAHSAKIAGEDNNGDYKLDAKMSNAKPQTESYNKNKRGYRETSVYKKTPVDRPLKKGEKWKLENLAIQLINEYIAKKKQESNNK